MRAKEYLSSRAVGFLPDDRPRDPAHAPSACSSQATVPQLLCKILLQLFEARIDAHRLWCPLFR